jgi:hypothetical protein
MHNEIELLVALSGAIVVRAFWIRLALEPGRLGGKRA